MQVRSCHPARAANCADDFTRFQGITFRDIDVMQMAIHCDEPLAMIDKNRLAIKEIVPRINDNALGRRPDGGPDTGYNIEP